MRVLRGRFGVTRVIAAVALFVALGGGAYAAGKLDGSAIKKRSIPGNRIEPESVRSKQVKNLLAKDFKPGQLPAGEPGPPGAQGPAGPTGGFDPATPLAAGKTISGTFAGNAGNGGNLEAAITFVPNLAADLPPGSVHRLEPGATSAACPGPGQAAAGTLCVYERAKNVNFNVILNPVSGGNGASRFGAVVAYSSGAANGFVDGTWSVTAP